MKKIIILAQTPPPHHGQAIMQQFLADAGWEWCTKKHIRLDFSDNIESVTKFKITKIFKLIRIIFLFIKERLIGPIGVVYYPPSGPHRVSFYRDLILLPILRLLSGKIIFHFHAGGFDQILKKFNALEIFFAKMIYGRPDLAIALLPSLMNEVQWIKPKKLINIPNGIRDVFDLGKKITIEDEFSILFVGNLIEEKGVLILIDAIRKLDSNKKIKIKLIGGWRSKEFKSVVEKNITANNLSGRVEFSGIKEGDDKWKYFYEADIFCLPTFETEGMPITIIEAMMFGLPIISTKWRSIAEILTDGKEGILVPVRDSDSLAKNISLLIENKNLRVELGKNARAKYLSDYMIEKHIQNMESAFRQLE